MIISTQQVIAICEEVNVWIGPLTIEQVRDTLRKENGGREPSDIDLLRWLGENYSLHSGSYKVLDIEDRKYDSHVQFEEN
jgi:hypothetical protein